MKILSFNSTISFIILCASVALLFLVILRSTIFAPVDPNKSVVQEAELSDTYIKSPPEVLGWIPYWDQLHAMESFSNHVDAFSAIAVFWHTLAPNGSVTTHPSAIQDQELINLAHTNGVSVYATIANLPTALERTSGQWDSARVEKAIATHQARSAHAQDIVAAMEAENFDGVIIDYEALNAGVRENFAEFIKILAAEVHQRHKFLGVTYAAKTVETISGQSETQILDALARYADKVYIMAYDQHWPGSEAGSISGLPWLERVIQFNQQHIPPNKLAIGLPLYGYDWGGNRPARGLTYSEVQQLVSAHSSQVQWDHVAQNSYFHYEENGDAHTVVFEDTRSIKAKLDMLSRQSIEHVFLWRLGGEDTEIWDAIRSFLRK